MYTATTYLKRIKKRISGDDDTGPVLIKENVSDRDFQRIVQELRDSGIMTQKAVKEFLLRPKMSAEDQSEGSNRSVGTTRSISTTKTASTARSSVTSKNLFEGKGTFLEETMKQVAESAKTPIYRNDSETQQRNLIRIEDVFEWSESSEKLIEGPKLMEDELAEIEALAGVVVSSEEIELECPSTSNNDAVNKSQCLIVNLNDSIELSDLNVTGTDDSKKTMKREGSTKNKKFLVSFRDIEDALGELENSANQDHNDNKPSKTPIKNLSKNFIVSFGDFLSYDSDHEEEEEVEKEDFDKKDLESEGESLTAPVNKRTSLSTFVKPNIFIRELPKLKFSYAA